MSFQKDGQLEDLPSDSLTVQDFVTQVATFVCNVVSRHIHV